MQQFTVEKHYLLHSTHNDKFKLVYSHLFSTIFINYMVGRVQTIIFKTIGTDSPQVYCLRKIYSPAPPFQCCVSIFIIFQAATVSAYSTTTLIGEGAGEGRNYGGEPGPRS